MDRKQVILGSFEATVVLDDDGHLLVLVKSLDGSNAVYMAGDMGSDGEVCIRVTTGNIEMARRNSEAEPPRSTVFDRAVATYAKYGQVASAEQPTLALPSVAQQQAVDSYAADLEKAEALGFDSVKAMWDHQSWLEKHGTPEYLAWLVQLRQSAT